MATVTFAGRITASCFTLTRCLLMAPNPLRRVNHTAARPLMPEPAPTCPFCGAANLPGASPYIERVRDWWVCAICAFSWLARKV